MRSSFLRSSFAVLALVGLSGCTVVPPSSMTFANTTEPVSVGPITRLAGAASMDGPVNASVRIEAKNQYQFTSSAGGGGTVFHQTEDASKFDVAADEALGNCAGCRARVGKLWFGSHSAVFIGTTDDTHWTGAKLELSSEAR